MNLLRRADKNACFATLAAKLALEDAKINLEKKDSEKIGLIMGTTQGPIAYTEDYYKELVINSPNMVSPLLFSNSDSNSFLWYGVIFPQKDALIFSNCILSIMRNLLEKSEQDLLQIFPSIQNFP